MASDRRFDLAFLRTSAPVLATAPLRGERRLKAGERLSTIGFPTRRLPPLRPETTELVVAGYNRTGTHFQVQGKIWPGNSGGPAFDAEGLVGGVIVAAIDTPAVYKKSGELIRDIGFLISGSTVTSFLERSNVPYRSGKSVGTGDKLLQLCPTLQKRAGGGRRPSQGTGATGSLSNFAQTRAR